jgi:glutathione peroxidase
MLSVPGCDSRVVQVDPASRAISEPQGVYALGCNDVDGNAAGLQQFEGEVTLLVNVASHCGYTGQYATLQTLHNRYADRGFSVIAFPCNDFGGQEPGSAKDIKACASTYGAVFPMMEKLVIKDGQGQSPIYAMLREQVGVLPRWNFGKYLVDANGHPLAFFGSNIDPLDPTLTDRIDALLAAAQPAPTD